MCGPARPGFPVPMTTSAGPLSFQRIVDVPFETCVAALDSWQPTGRDGELRSGDSLPRGPIEHDRDAGTCRIHVRRWRDATLPGRQRVTLRA